MTPHNSDEVKRKICGALPVQPGGIVSDYSSAAIAMTSGEVLQMMLGGDHDLPELPAAVVASDSMCHSLYSASVTAAWAGRWRYVCRSASLALDWVRRQQAAARRRPHCQGLR